MNKPAAPKMLLAPVGGRHKDDKHTTPSAKRIADDVETIKEIAKNLGMKMDQDSLADKMFTISTLYDNFCVEAISEVFGVSIDVIENIVQKVDERIAKFNVQNALAMTVVEEIYNETCDEPDIDEVMEELKSRGFDLIPEDIVTYYIAILRCLSSVMEKNVKAAVKEYEAEQKK